MSCSVERTTPSKRPREEEEGTTATEAPVVADTAAVAATKEDPPVVPDAAPTTEEPKGDDMEVDSAPADTTTPTKTVRPVPSDVLLKLAKMQDALNRFIDPQWLLNRKPDDWALAVTLECAELIDSYPWKWWKSVAKPADLNNVRIELVDILHFSLSGVLQMRGADSEGRLSTGSSAAGTTEGATDTPKTVRVYPRGFQSPLTDAANAVTTFRQAMRHADTHQFDLVTTFVLMAAADLDFNLVAYYVAKHTLNHIRQLGGYKKGEYKKVDAAGMEDNTLLHSCIEGVTYDEICSDFDACADSILSKVYDVFTVPQDERKTIAGWLAQH